MLTPPDMPFLKCSHYNPKDGCIFTSNLIPYPGFCGFMDCKVKMCEKQLELRGE